MTAPDAKPNETLASRVAWSPDGRWLAGAYGKQVRIWDADTRKHLRTITTEFPGNDSLAWHKESQLLAVTGEGFPRPTCFIFDTASGSCLFSVKLVFVFFRYWNRFREWTPKMT